MLCVNGCNRPAFGKFPTCCTHCKGRQGPHAADCEAKAKMALEASGALKPSRSAMIPGMASAGTMMASAASAASGSASRVGASAAAAASGGMSRVSAGASSAASAASATASAASAAAASAASRPSALVASAADGFKRMSGATDDGEGFLHEVYDNTSWKSVLFVRAAGGGKTVAEIHSGCDEVFQAGLDDTHRIAWSRGHGGSIEYTVLHPDTTWVRVVRAAQRDLTTWRCYSSQPPFISQLKCSEGHELERKYGTALRFTIFAQSRCCDGCEVDLRHGVVRWSCSSCDYEVCCTCAEKISRSQSKTRLAPISSFIASAAGPSAPSEDTSRARWVRLKRGQPIPRDAVVSGSTKQDGTVWVGKFQGEAGKINADDGKMWNFWGNDSRSQMDAYILVCPDGKFEWLRIQRGDPVPENAVQAGQTRRDGMTYVGRYAGEAGKINIDDGKMWNFWGHTAGGHQDAEIMVTIEESHGAGEIEMAPPGTRGRSGSSGYPTAGLVSGYFHCEHVAGKSTDSQKNDAVKRLNRLLLHGDVYGADLMLARAKKLQVPAPEISKAEAVLQSLKSEGEFALLRA